MTNHEFRCPKIPSFVIFWILGNLPKLQARIVENITKQIHIFFFSFYILRLAYTF